MTYIFQKSSSTFFFSLLLLSLYSGTALGQSASPYSRYGLGYVRSSVFSANKGMGGLAAPYASALNINYTNPASYASLTRTTLEIGMNMDGVSIVTGDSVYKAGNGSISHLAIAFVPNPRLNNWAISAGLLPYSNINYNFIQNFNDTASLGSFREIFTGSGSLYQAYLGGAYKVKGFSVGANAGYLFGKLDYEKLITFPDSADSYATRNINSLNVKSFVYNVGFQYQRLIYSDQENPDERRKIFMTVGVYGSGGMKMNARISNYWERLNIIGDVGVVSVDTTYANFNQKGKVNLPFNLGAGVMFGNERFWMVGADFKFMNWENFSSPLNNSALNNSWRISAGMQITPKMDDRKFFNRVQYRLGAYYGKSEIVTRGMQLGEYGGTFGFGIPFKAVGRLNISGDIGSRGGNSTAIIRENYYRFTLGLVINDIWFIKRKFD